MAALLGHAHLLTERKPDLARGNSPGKGLLAGERAEPRESEVAQQRLAVALAELVG